MFGLGPTELILILALVLIIFGAGKLPQVFGSMGKAVKEFRDASEGTDTANGATPVTVQTTETTKTVG
ncbi:MAG: twin-arginine translocase TatA/TatE family subunit [Chloroflexia bacterium]